MLNQAKWKANLIKLIANMITKRRFCDHETPNTFRKNIHNITHFMILIHRMRNDFTFYKSDMHHKRFCLNEMSDVIRIQLRSCLARPKVCNQLLALKSCLPHRQQYSTLNDHRVHHVFPDGSYESKAAWQLQLCTAYYNTVWKTTLLVYKTQGISTRQGQAIRQLRLPMTDKTVF